MKAAWMMNTISILFIFIFVGLLVLMVQSLLKHIRSKNMRQEKTATIKLLGNALKQHRVWCNMTQEFVAETVGVSRKVISKWENGKADPSASDFLTLIKLYRISSEELLKIMGS